MLQSRGVSSGLVPSSSHQPISCMYFTFPPIRATCPTSLILLDLITRIIFGNTKHEVSHYVIFCRFLLYWFCSQLMQTHRHTDSIQSSRKGTDWKTSSWKTKSRMNVIIAICLGDEMFGKPVCECALSVLLTAVLLSSVCALSVLLTAMLLSSVCERSAEVCCKWQISNRLHVQSISRRGSAWRRVMQRHAPSRYSSGLREAQLYCDTAPGHTEQDCDRQTGTIYYVNYVVFVYNVIFYKFLPAIGCHLNISTYR